MNIKLFRERKHMTQLELGEKLDLTQSMISRLERDPSNLSVRQLKQLVRVLDIDAESVMDWLIAA